MLYSRFESLPEEKKKRILEVSIEEFAQNGYENASTNSIVAKSGISKGILFHYFGNKKNLYLYIFNYTIDFMTEYVQENYNNKSTGAQADIFEKIMHMGLIKIRMAHEFSTMYRLVLNAYTHTPEAVKKELQEIYEKAYKTGMPALLKDIDTSKFRKGINTDKAIELIMLSLEGVNNKYLKMFKDKDMAVEHVFSEMENILEEYNDYIDILKRGVYGDKE